MKSDSEETQTSAVLATLVQLAIPLMLSNIFYTAQISIDRLLLSWYDSAATGAAFAASMLFYAPFMFLSATASFSATFVSQYLGSGQPRRIGPMVAQALWFSVVAGVLFMGFAPLTRPLLAWVGHEPQLLELEAPFLFCLAFCALPMTINAAIAGFFAGIQRPYLAIWINIVGCLVNGVLDWLLIFGNYGFPEMGILGAGIATVVGSYAAMVVALVLVWAKPMHQNYGTRFWRFDLGLMRQYLAYAAPNGLQAGFDIIAWALFTLFIGRLGTAVLAASSIVILVNAWFFIPMLGLAQAVSVYVGEKLGADRPELAEKGVWIGFALAASFMTLLGLLVALLPGPLLALFQSREDPVLWAETAQYVPTLLWFVAVYSIFDSMNLVFAFALRGAGDTRFVSVATLVLGVCLLLIPVYEVSVLGLGVYWAWACATVYIAGLGFTFLGRFLWGTWRSLRVIDAAHMPA